MSAQRKMDMRNFLKNVNRKDAHLANMQVQIFHDEEKAEVEAEKRKQLAIQIADENEVRRIEARRSRLSAKESQIAGDKRSDAEVIQDAIDSVVVEEIPDIIPAEKESRKRKNRPINWEDIAYEASVYGNEAAAKTYADEFSDATSSATYQRLNQWKHDVKNKRILSSSTIVRLPSYGTEIDSLLLDDCKATRSVGLPVDDVILRRLLVDRLQKAGKAGLMKENGGKYSYGHSFATRFFKRHNLVLRVCTTKMRELPADFEDKKSKYMKIGADLIYKHNVPPQLVINGDETALQLVNRARVTRNEIGAKHV